MQGVRPVPLESVGHRGDNPHMRGGQDISKGDTEVFTRIIPTCVGARLMNLEKTALFWDNPHIREDKSAFRYKRSLSYG